MNDDSTVTDSKQDDIKRFLEEYAVNESKAQRYSRWMHRVQSVDRFTAISIPILFILLGAAYFLQDGPDIIYKSVLVVGVVVFLLISVGIFISISHTFVLFFMGIRAETIAGNEFRKAIIEYQKGDWDADTIVDHITNCNNFLSFSSNPKYISKKHVSAIGEYSNQLKNAKDLEKAINSTFPQVSDEISSAFAYPSQTRTESAAKTIELSPSYSPGTIEGLKEDAKLLYQLLGRETTGAIVIGLALGAAIYPFFGFWKSTTGFLGVMTLYGVLQNVE